MGKREAEPRHPDGRVQGKGRGLSAGMSCRGRPGPLGFSEPPSSHQAQEVWTKLELELHSYPHLSCQTSHYHNPTGLSVHQNMSPCLKPPGASAAPTPQPLALGLPPGIPLPSLSESYCPSLPGKREYSQPSRSVHSTSMDLKTPESSKK